jgi:hypothetical protein
MLGSTVALLLIAQEPGSLESVRRAAEETGKTSYAYSVTGRFKRTGVSAPPSTLTARIDLYQSARHGPLILIKGPEGLWKTPDERIGEKVEGTPPEVADMVKTLQEAEPPHEMLIKMLEEVRGAPDPESPTSFAFSYAPDRVRASLEKQLDKALDRGTVSKPDEVRWTTVRGLLKVKLDRKGGVVTSIREERSVRLIYRREGVPEEAKTYKLEMEFALSDHGAAKVDLPPEVRSRLKMDR